MKHNLKFEKNIKGSAFNSAQQNQYQVVPKRFVIFPHQLSPFAKIISQGNEIICSFNLKNNNTKTFFLPEN